ncbi:MAG: YciI family protein [Thermomicrobiales bacterium]
MHRYLISFDDGTMILAEEDFEAVSAATRATVNEAKQAGVWNFGGGLFSQRASVVAVDGTVTDGPFPETKAVLGGFCVLELPSRDDALTWAARFAAACRCPQEVREIMWDPESMP